MWVIVLAVCNGVFIGLSRSLNARLGQDIGVISTSVVNHIVGFVCLFVYMAGSNTSLPQIQWQEHWILFFGGMIGAIYVSLNSWLIVKLGVRDTLMWVLCGQMLTALVLDVIQRQHWLNFSQCLAIGLICGAVLLPKLVRTPQQSSQ